MPAPAKKVDKGPGIVFPPGPKGDRSTTEAGKSLFAAAMLPVDEKESKEVAEKWGRYRYAKYVVKNVEKSLRSPEDCLAIAEAGLSWAHDNFEFIRPGTEEVVPLSEEMRTNKGTFETGVIKGEKAKPTEGDLEIVVPYKGKNLKGDELLVQLEKWVRKDVIEPSCAAAITQAVKTKRWLDLSDQYFVLLGAGSAMGPLAVLLALGANVIAVDICPKAFRPAGVPADPKRAGPWKGPMPDGRKGLVAACKDSCGTLTFPLPRKQSEMSMDEIYDEAGCNLLTQPAEIKNWLMKLYPGKQMTVGAYAYLDGDRFVKISVSMDAIIKPLTEERKPPAALAYLCTPTDAHVVSAGARDACKSNNARAPIWQHLGGLVGLTKPNKVKAVTAADGNDLYVTDCIVVNQGPNYITAKRLQHWRAMVARETAGCVVSSNIAPSTATISVVSNRSFQWAYWGMHHFKPMEVFEQETTNAVMGALLIHDLRNEYGVSYPETKLRNPLELFTEGSFHGGAWRLGFTFNSIGTPSALAYFVGGLGLTQYLTAYNATQAIGWAYMAMMALTAFFREPTFDAASTPSAWSIIGPSLTIFQNLALLECLHSMAGFVSAPWHSTLLQIISRVFVVGLFNWIPEIADSSAIFLLAFAWGITEVTRYSWYAMNLQGIKIKQFTWLRYSTFLVLYPLGVFGELLSCYHSLPTLAAKKYATGAEVPYFVQWCLLPACNALGMGPDSVFIYIVLPLYIVGLAFLYSYMLSQRKKAIARLYPKPAGGKKAKAE